jgi:hypothetical protein
MPAADIIMSRPSSAQAVSQLVLAGRVRTVGCSLRNFHDAGPAGTVFAILVTDNTLGAVRARRTNQPHKKPIDRGFL